MEDIFKFSQIAAFWMFHALSGIYYCACFLKITARVAKRHKVIKYLEYVLLSPHNVTNTLSTDTQEYIVLTTKKKKGLEN